MIIRVCSDTNATRLNQEIQREVNVAYSNGHFLQEVSMQVTPRVNQNFEIHSVLLVFGEIPTS